jgi:hypothetical protein
VDGEGDYPVSESSSVHSRIAVCARVNLLIRRASNFSSLRPGIFEHTISEPIDVAGQRSRTSGWLKRPVFFSSHRPSADTRLPKRWARRIMAGERSAGSSRTLRTCI